MPVSTRSGEIVPLSALAHVEYNSGPEAITRREKLRAITISVTPPLTMPLEEAMLVIEDEIVTKLHEDGTLDGLQSAVEADPNDHQARLDLASALIASGDHDGGAEHLLAIIAADKDWNDGAAREKLLSLFEMVGLEDEWVATTRRKLSALLFG